MARSAASLASSWARQVRPRLQLGAEASLQRCAYCVRSQASPLTAASSRTALRRHAGARKARSDGAYSARLVHTASQASAPIRTHQCGLLRRTHDGQQVTIAGWLLPLRRMSKTLGFLRLQDASGQIQVVVRSPENDGSGGKDAQALLDRLQSIPLQSVLSVRGTVLPRREGTINAAMPTGEIEIELQDFTVLNEADRDLPFQPHDAANLANDALRSRYRYLDLRRPELARNIQLRSRVARTVRDHLHKCGFDEVETPVLLRSTPEGAAEFLVPTRTSKIKGTNEPLFYALPQSPQQPKQLLIASGCVDKYYQFAKCFRDEDSRKDRQVEFTQIDLEMGFVSQSAPSAESDWRMGGSEVREVVEGMVSAVWQEVKGVELGRLPVITYEHAMATYGSDKPDRRFGMQIQSISSALRSHDGEAEAPASVVEMFVSTSEGLSNSAVKALTAATGVEHFKAKPGSPHELAALLLKKSSHVAGYLRAADFPATEVDVEFLAKRCEEAMASESSACHVFVASRPLPSAGGSTKLGDLRLALAAQLESTGVTVRRDMDDMFWVTEFPLFTQEEGGEWSSTHHPFTAPLAEDLHLLDAVSDEQIAKIRGQHYDLVLNGTEIGGGSVRIHRAELQEKVMRDVLGLSNDERKRFAHLLHALRCGAPPHGGIALGFDRLMSILCGASSIRDVIAFPKTATGADPVFGSPAPSPSQQVLTQYGLKPL